MIKETTNDKKMGNDNHTNTNDVNNNDNHTNMNDNNKRSPFAEAMAGRALAPEDLEACMCVYIYIYIYIYI